MKLIIIISLSLYLFSANFFRNDNYVVDKKHKLMWQDTRDNISIIKNQKDAIQYCEDLNLLEYTNWKLPTREQYTYIIDKRRKDELKINHNFQYIIGKDYWTSETTWRNLGRYGYYVFFKSGAIYYNNKTYHKFVRCVRKLK